MPQRADVVVIGAGLSGLVAAHTLHRRGVNVRILEANDRPGGVIASIASEGFLYETAANSALDNQPAVGELIEALDLGRERVDVSPHATRRYVVRDGAPVALPGSPPALVTTRAFRWRAKVRLLREPFIAPGDGEREESIAEFALRRLGREVLDYAIDPFVSGVYAGDPARISASAAFPRMVALERRHGSLLRGQLAQARSHPAGPSTRNRSFSFRGGMQRLTDALAASLPEIEYGTRVTSIARRAGGGYAIDVAHEGASPGQSLADAIVLAVPAAAASALVRPLSEPAASLLEAIEYAPVAIVATGYRRGDVTHALDGFGMLVPAVERRDILGTLFSSSLFSGRAPDGDVLLTTFVGGARRPALVAEDDDALSARVAGELAHLLGARAPVWRRIVRWPRAIPQYVLGHRERIAQIDSALAGEPMLRFAANWRGGVAVGDCVANARGTAEALCSDVGVR